MGGSGEGVAGNLERKYPESLAEKKKEGDFGSITEEGQELSLPKQQGEKGKGVLKSTRSNHPFISQDSAA